MFISCTLAAAPDSLVPLKNFEPCLTHCCYCIKEAICQVALIRAPSSYSAENRACTCGAAVTAEATCLDPCMSMQASRLDAMQTFVYSVQSIVRIVSHASIGQSYQTYQALLQMPLCREAPNMTSREHQLSPGRSYLQ